MSTAMPASSRLTGDGRIVLAACWSHTRRKFYDVHQATDSPIAGEAVRRIAGLYAIEKTIRGKPPAERLAVRQAKTRPLVMELRQWLEAQLPRVPQSGKPAEVIRYALVRWDGLSRFLDDGRIELDTNPVERAIRPVSKRVSLCTPYSSVCKHWKCIRVDDATRATFPGYRSFNRLRRQIVGTDLIRRTKHNLHSRKGAGFDKTPYRVVCDA